MKICVNHPQKEAFATCHNCGRDFCAECLDEGSEFYYCKAVQCQEALRKELLPEKISCPNCSSSLDLTFSERKMKKFHCPECEAYINYNLEPVLINPKENYVILLSSMNQGDIGVIKSILNDAHIDYYLSGENFLTVEPLIQAAKFHVNVNDLETAAELLKDYNLNPWGAS